MNTKNHIQSISEKKITKVINDRTQKHLQAINDFEINNEKNIIKSVELINSCFLSGGTVFSVGNGGSAADSMHFASELSGNYGNYKEPLPAISLASDSSTLTCIGNDFDFAEIFSRQIEAHFKVNDLLLAITTSGRSENIIKAIEKAKAVGGKVILLSSDKVFDNKEISFLADIIISCDGIDTPSIQEFHKIIIHILVESIFELR